MLKPGTKLKSLDMASRDKQASQIHHTFVLERDRIDEKTMVADFGVVLLLKDRDSDFLNDWDDESWRREIDHLFARQFFNKLPFNILSEDAVSPDSTVGSPYFQLLREWLWDCDQKHDKCKLPKGREKYWPTRVIFIGEPNKLTLVENQATRGDYVVLSHCWGAPTNEEKERFCTTRETHQQRLQGFSCDDLPQTFQDAVRTTRELGKQYLWIDSVCIIQGDDGDWQKEAGEMENVFASAFCTIAASSAGGWGDGFLKRGLDSQYIRESCAFYPFYPAYCQASIPSTTALLTNLYRRIELEQGLRGLKEKLSLGKNSLWI
ncbi:heterokaryon incompatibility protein-domain-containing protein [Dactylonectria macrodidyma]|uniref:Heterokaryon incompatibility protein-domain-containing protein n=1 Tax=Dactylonectria macrodidyma TaxID=307937 RepID=A0A9P9FSV7_9HYPO|nr:heterokaryon incompatibility protein-domain-containing protein [Dactylonectria macrodidyma]